MVAHPYDPGVEGKLEVSLGSVGIYQDCVSRTDSFFMWNTLDILPIRISQPLSTGGGGGSLS